MLWVITTPTATGFFISTGVQVEVFGVLAKIVVLVPITVCWVLKRYTILTDATIFTRIVVGVCRILESNIMGVLIHSQTFLYLINAYRVSIINP